MEPSYRNCLRSFPEQLESSRVTVRGRFWRAGRRIRPAYRTGRPDAVVIAGMGGSGIAGDLLAHFAPRLRLPVPVVVWKNFGLPPLPFRNPLVIAISFSGETSETLSAFRAARARGYLRGAVAAGGSLARLSALDESPLATFTPPPRLTPREGLGYTYTALVRLLSLWFPRLRNPNFSRSVRPRSLERVAGRVARTVGDRPLSLFLSASYAPVGYFWKAVLNETAKRPTDMGLLPESCHNSIMGFSGRPKRAAAVFLTDPAARAEERRVTRAFQNLVARKGVSVTSVPLPGASVEERTWNGILMGHYVALALAEASGKDPRATPLITELKARLRRQRRR